MPKKKSRTFSKRKPPYLRLPPKHGKLTPTAKNLYDLIFFYGLGGCWMSNLTITKHITCSRSSVQRARKLLVKRQLIITARANPHTWVMWSRYHQAVEHCQTLLYPKNQQLDNPWYIIQEDPKGVSKQQKAGIKLTPKLYVESESSKTQAQTLNEACEEKEAGSAGRSEKPQGDRPPETPGGSGKKGSETEMEKKKELDQLRYNFYYKFELDRQLALKHPQKTAEKIAHALVWKKHFS